MIRLDSTVHLVEVKSRIEYFLLTILLVIINNKSFFPSVIVLWFEDQDELEQKSSIS